MIVTHYTAGSTLSGAVNHLKRPSVKASAHLVVDRDGKTVQLVDLNKKAWHAGRSVYLDRSGINRYSIGIEIVNEGWLRKSGDGFISIYGRRYSASEVIQATHKNETQSRYWHTYTEEQLHAVFEICQSLVDHYSIRYIVGHDEIAPERKTDPGPAFPLDQLRRKIFERRSDDDSPEDTTQQRLMGTVSASLLNIRERPSTDGSLAREPLPFGTSLEILQSKNGWLRVKTEQMGWVKEEYVKRLS
jgi:N-acetylmuramoyl-L-alanine amidase